MSDAFVHVTGVTKRFGSVVAVDHAELSIPRGAFFSLLGPSGCGKTTLLRMIGGFATPDEGEVFIDGERVTELSPNRRPTNMVFQSYAIFPHLNVFDNIAYGLRKERLTRAELARRVDEALAMIALEGFGARRANELSGGQRQRVALARALVKQPKVLLLDEPLGALDRRLREAMQVELRQLQKSLGITFLLVTHDQEEALSMSDAIAVMSAGRILQVASPRELYEQPNCREVADFIGAMNFFEGTVVARDGASAVIDAGPIGTVRAASDVAAGTSVLLAIRPEKIALVRTAVPGAVAGTVAATTYLGERTHYVVAVRGRAQPIVVSAQNADAVSTVAPGESVFLSLSEGAIVVLPR